nr:immunoglobulin heavy chain junction region [Mus musculus]MBK4197465.1 immunoglobulin heavy chain junction region [Mus musculus]MBK4197466.1 immunoglobulin heavy chain junction region [Mus musculus]MBK4197467.1 immunoglobulin heavy chain junction region [Mus musculus]
CAREANWGHYYAMDYW